MLVGDFWCWRTAATGLANETSWRMKQRWPSAGFPRGLFGTLLCATLIAGALTAGNVVAGAASSAHYIPASCDITTVEDPIINFPQVVSDPSQIFTDQEICGVEAIENDAYDMYAYSHGMDPGDPRLSSANGNDISGIQVDIAGIIFALLQQIVQAHAAGTTLTTDEQGAYDWLQQVVSGFNVLAAQDAQNEYTKWNNNQCTYVPPNTTLFSFRAANDPACGGGLSTLFAGPSPPSFEEFVEYGMYDADQTLHLNSALGGSSFETLVQEKISESQASWSAILLGAVPEGLSATGQFNTLLEAATLVKPFARELAEKEDLANAKQFLNQQKLLRDLAAQQAADEGGPEVSTEVAEGASEAAADATDAGIDTGSAVASLGAEVLTGPFFIAGIAVAVLVQAAIQIAAEINLPTQLQNNINNANQAVEDALASTSGAGFATVLTDFESQLDLPSPTIGTAGHVVTSAPNDGSQFEVSRADASQNIVSTQDQSTVDIATWPLGLSQGIEGAPEVNIAYYNGQSYQQVGPDDQLAGLSGWVPSGEIHYFDWAGIPRIAFIDGTQFLTVSGPGSADLGGDDIGDMCAPATGTDCQFTNFLDLLGTGQQIEPSYTTTVTSNGGLTEVQTYHASDGHVDVQPTDIRYRISLKPDTGTQALQNIVNHYGNPASQYVSNGGGLDAGDSVTFTDPETSSLGASTTYKWEIETRCPYDPAHPVHEVQGVPVCYGSSDYNSATLPVNEADVTTCDELGVCTEDPAFHGNPVEVVTSQSTNFTWPMPGTYHVRLITTDQYDHVNQSDQDVVVAGSNPTVSLTSSIGNVGAGVFGPIQNGQSLAITGCINSVSGAYDNPQVSVNWGDATPNDTASGQDDTSSNISFTQNPSNCSGAGWSFTATHTYQVTSKTYQVQEPVQITVGDGEGDSVTLNPYVAIQFNAQPGFTSANSATFIVGSTGNFTISAPANPTASISISSGTLPSGLGFDDNHNGTATITGDPSINEGGSYPLTLKATNGTGPNEGTVTQSFTFNVDTAPTFSTSSTQALPVGTPANFDITASGYPVPTVTVSGDTVPGLSDPDISNFDNSQSLIYFGTPTAQGVYHLRVSATNAAGTTTQLLTITVGSLPEFSSPSSASFVTNSASSFTVVTSGTPAASLSLEGTLPNGLFFHDNGDGTATIFGTPTGITTADVTIEATNSNGSVTQDLTVVASPTGGPSITVSGSEVSEQVLDPSTGLELYTGTFTADQSGPSVTITSSDSSAPITEIGTLPSGITFTDNGDGTATITGTPTTNAGGYYALQITSTPSSGPTGIGFVQLVVNGPPIITSASTALFQEGTNSTFEITSSGIATARYSLDGSLPAGLSFNDPGLGTATISGTPTGPGGISTVAIESTSIENYLDPIDTTLTIEVDVTPSISSSSNVTFAEGVAGTFSVTSSGYPVPTLTLIGSPPPGITFVDNGDGTGTFSGTPTDTTSLVYPVTLEASSTAGTTTQSMTISVGPLPTITSSPSATFLVGSSGASFSVISSSTSPSSLSVTGLPSGLSFLDSGNGTGSISGSPDVCSGGNYSTQVTATNAYGSAEQNLTIVVDEAPSFVGSGSGSCSSPDRGDTTPTLVVGDPGGVTLYSAGYPSPTLSLSGVLPDGVTFSDNGDGSGDLSGNPTDGTGGIYPVTLSMTNVEGTATQSLNFVVDEEASGTSDGQATWIAGQSNTFTIQTAGYPSAMSVDPFSPSEVPSWITWTDNGDGTATLAGTPPLSLLDTNVPNDLVFDIPYTIGGQGFGNGGFGDILIDVAPLNFITSSPPSALTVNTSYSYGFTTTDPNATFALASGDTLPDGLTLSASGVLAGSPTSVGTWQFSVQATNANGTVETQPIVLTVHSAVHQLEISAFRLYGPDGRGDWFVSAQNTTSTPIQLYGWEVGIFVPGSTSAVLEPLPVESLAPGATVTVAGPYFSMLPLIPTDFIGPSSLANPGGFEIISPDGTISDKVGQVGAPSSAIAGAGVPVPSGTNVTAQSAYERNLVGGVLVDTNNNASDFTFQSIAFAQSPVTFSSTATSPYVGTTYTPTAGGGSTGNAIVYSIYATSTPNTCNVSSSIVDFLNVGTCIVTATMPGNTQYLEASVTQSITVVDAPSETAAPASLVTTSTVTTPVKPTSSSTLTLGTGLLSVTVYVPKGAVSKSGIVSLSPVGTASSTGFSFTAGTVAVTLDVTSSGGKAITSFAQPVDLTFPNAPEDFVPAYSHNGTTWTAIPVIPDPPTLPSGWSDGWYRDSSGSVHILTLHATDYALLTSNSAVAQALVLTASVARKLNIDKTTVISLHLASSFPSTATITLTRGSRTFVVWHTKTSTTEKTYRLRLPLTALQKGTETLTISANGVDDTASQTITLNLFTQPIPK